MNKNDRAVLSDISLTVTIPVTDILNYDIDIKSEFEKLGYDVVFDRGIHVTKSVGKNPLTYYSLGEESKKLKSEVESIKNGIKLSGAKK